MNHKGKKLRIKNGIKNDRRMGEAGDIISIHNNYIYLFGEDGGSLS